MKKSKLAVIFGLIILAVAGLSSAFVNWMQLPVNSAGAVSMYKDGTSESVTIAATAKSFGVDAVPEAVTALIKAGADAGKVTAAAVSVGANPATVVNNAVAAGATNSTVVASAMNAGATPAIATQGTATIGTVAGVSSQGMAVSGFTGVTPLVTPVPSGGGGGVPASRG